LLAESHGGLQTDDNLSVWSLIITSWALEYTACFGEDERRQWLG